MLYTQKKPIWQVADMVYLSKINIKPPATQTLNNYFIKEDIIGALMNPQCPVSILSRPDYSLERTIYNQKKRLIDSFQKKMPSNTMTFFSSLFLGWRKLNKNEYDKLKRTCRLWGISHYLARSDFI